MSDRNNQASSYELPFVYKLFMTGALFAVGLVLLFGGLYMVITGDLTPRVIANGGYPKAVLLTMCGLFVTSFGGWCSYEVAKGKI